MQHKYIIEVGRKGLMIDMHDSLTRGILNDFISWEILGIRQKGVIMIQNCHRWKGMAFENNLTPIIPNGEQDINQSTNQI